MRTNQDLARTVMAAKLLTDLVKDMADSDRRALVDALASGDIERFTVRGADGTDLGKIVHVAGKPKAKVVDRAAFTAWVKANRPDQIREVVDAPYEKVVLKTATVEGIAVDTETGAAIPGIELVDSTGYISVRENDAARNIAKAAVVGHRLLSLGVAPPETSPPAQVDVDDDWGMSDGDDW